MRWGWHIISLAAILMIATVENTQGSRILFVSPIASKSHKIFFTAVVNALADNGHQITVLTPLKPSKSRENVREVVLDDLDVHEIVPELFEWSYLFAMMTMAKKAPAVCANALAKREVQDLLHEEFDLGFISIFVSDCFLSLFHKLKLPYIHVSPTNAYTSYTALVGNPIFPSFTPAPLVEIFPPYTFAERFVNTLQTVWTLYYADNVVIYNIEAECRQRGLCPQDMPSLIELRYNASAIMFNSIINLKSPPQPYLHNVLHVGGIHCKESEPLPQDLEEWVAEAGEDGFIFFSLGSIIKPSSIPEKYRKILVEVFGSLKQRILWKWNDTIEDLPPNVRLGKWLPQQNILGDPRLQLFITHGGGLSTQESIYHGTPVLGLPVFADQMGNMVEVQNEGWGRYLTWDNLDTKSLKDTILSLIMNDTLRPKVQRKSALMRDQLIEPSRVVNYWVEHVIKHNGAPHLRSPLLSMPWYKIYNVDVWLTVVMLILVVSLLVLKLVISLCRCLLFSKPKAKMD